MHQKKDGLVVTVCIYLHLERGKGRSEYIRPNHNIRA